MNEFRITISRSTGRVVVAVLALLALAGIQTPWAAHSAPQVPQTGNWEQQAPYPTHFAINGVDMVTATEAWAVAYTDIVHTTDGGVTWENQPRPGNENLYAVDFFDNQHGIAMGNTTLYTRNGGDTWNQGGSASGYDVEMADANLAFITDHRVAGYSRTTDGGATWAFRSMPSNITTIQSFDSLNLVAASPSGVYHSYDGGLNWSFVPGQGGEFVSTYFVNHNSGWLIYGNSASRTTDGGASWQVQTLPGGSWIYDMMFIDANNGWGVGNNVVRTTNGGATWQEVPLPQESLPLWDVDFVDAQHGIAGGDSFLNTDSVLITSSNGGASWATSSNGSINDVLNMVALDYDHAWATHDYGGKTSRTTDGGDTWQVSEVGNQYVVLTGIDMADTLRGWAVGYDTTYLNASINHTSDGGATWQQQYDPAAKYLQGVAVLDAQTAIIVGGWSGSGSIMRRTTDEGATWHSLNVPLVTYFYDVFFMDSQTGWMVGGSSSYGVILKSTDGGDSWVVQNNPAQYTLASIHFSDPNNGWAGGYYGTLVRTTNGGATWTLQNPQIPAYTHVLDVSSTSPMRGWISGYGGGAQSRPFVKYTTDGGTTWIEHTPLVGPYDSFAALAFLDDEYGWAAGAGGIFRHTGTGPPPTATATAVLPTNTPLSATTSSTATSTPTVNAIATATSVVSTPTQAQPTNTVTVPTSTAVPATSTPVAVTATATATATACAITFSDVQPGSTFYIFVQCLACRGIIGGYEDGSFRPDDGVTRGQLSKIVSNAAGFDDDVSGQTFSDVDPNNTFYLYIERMAMKGVIGGYEDGTFRPGNSATRGQITKIVSNARGYNDIPTTQTFEDVAPDHTFYMWIQRLASRGIMSGYRCGGEGEPCGLDNRPYFRPFNNATRGQTAKIVSNAFFPTCNP
jgi:photosystem II stability/assembly factor-like uncharacterized protein